MASNVLQFTLGLTTGGFISALGAADAKLKGFLSATLSLGAIAAGVWSQIEKGAALRKLSAETGESVSSLFKLQKALKTVGLEGDSAGNLVYMLEKSLGGVNEAGESTGYIFSQLGLNIDQLKRADAPTALATIAARLGQLDRASATAASGKIFGRYNAREFLVLARNADEFAAALRKGGLMGAMYEHSAEAFHKIDVAVTNAKGKLNALFLGLAVGIAPEAEKLADALNSIDLSKVGADMARILRGFIGAFQSGNLAQLIGDTLKLGFDTLLSYAPGIFEKIGFFLLKAFETPLIYIQAGLEYALTKAAHEFATSSIFRAIVQAIAPGAGTILGAIGDMGNSSFDQILADRKKEGPRFNLGTGEFGLGDINADANDRLSAATSQFKTKWAEYMKEVLGFATGAGGSPAARKTAAGSNVALGGAYERKTTDLEKIGFVMRGSAAQDHARTTAQNTSKLVDLTQKLLTKGGTPLGENPFINSHAY